MESNGLQGDLQGLKLPTYEKCIYETSLQIVTHGDIFYGIVVRNWYLYTQKDHERLLWLMRNHIVFDCLKAPNYWLQFFI